MIELEPKELVSIIITRREIESGDISNSLSVLHTFKKDKKSIRRFCNKIDLSISGYDDDPRELWEIPEVKSYIKQLDKAFPYWFYFITKHSGALKMIFGCCNDIARSNTLFFEIKPESMLSFLKSHIFAMNIMCDEIGMSEKEIEMLTNQNLQYINQSN
jgi:hypothetical protein